MDGENLVPTKSSKKIQKATSKESFCRKPDSLGDMATAGVKNINIKTSIFVFLLFLLLNTTLYVDNLLSKVPDAVTGRDPTGKGLLITGMVLTLGYILFDMLNQGGMV